MKIATIGSGMIVNLFLDAVDHVDGVECVAVYSRKEESAKALASKFQIRKTYTDLQSMLKDDEIDVVYIASPNSLHYQHCRAAFENNKHVICEKPLTSTMFELKELTNLAKSKDLFFFEAITTIHLPNFKEFLRMLPDIGKIKMVSCSFLQYSSKMDAFKAGEIPNVFNPEFSGGALMDLNVYNLHFAIAAFGDPSLATYHPILADNGIDVGGIMILQYPGFLVSCTAGKHVQAHNCADVFGENGMIHVDKEVSNFISFDLIKGDTTKSFNTQKAKNRMTYELKEFLRVYQTNDKKTAKDWMKHSLKVYQILHDAREKAGIVFGADKLKM